MDCKECGKPKCNGECGCKSPKVLQINNPAEYITFHKVSIPAAMGDSTTNPPKIGAYRNALVYYEADHTSWMYSTDGIPTKLTNGLTDYNEAVNLPQINGHTLIGNQSSSDLGIQGELTAGNGIDLDGTKIKAKIGDGLEFDNNGEIDIANIEQYAHFFDTVADMKAADLADGEFAVTAGYYTVNDGGGAKYKIVSSATADEYFVLSLDSGLFAKLIIENSQVNIRQIGARSQDAQNNKYDIAAYISAYLVYLDTVKDRVKLYIPSGVWYSSELTIHRANGFNIIGDEQFVHWINGGTIISSLEDNQDFIFKVGNGLAMQENFEIKNICFTTADFTYNAASNLFETSTGSIKTVNESCVIMQGCDFGETDNLYFQHINGRAFSLATSWEIRFRKLYFRDVNALGSSVMRIAPAVTAIQDSGVNASMFDNMMFEQVLGDLIECAKGCKFQNCSFGVINFEDYKVIRPGIVYTNITDDSASTVEANAVHFNIFKLPESGCQCHNIQVNNIQLNNVAYWYSTISGTDYVFDRLITTLGAYNLLGIIINNIDILGMAKDIVMLYSHDNVDQRSAFILNNIYNPNKYKMKFDIDNFTYIKCDSRRFISVGYQQRLNRSITPAHELVSARTSGNRYLISDDQCVNELGVATKMAANSNPFRFTVAGSTIYVRAKIPNGETYTVTVTGSHTQTENLVGTGSFKIYEITLGSQWNIGDYIQFNPAPGNTGTSMLIDYFIN